MPKVPQFLILFILLLSFRNSEGQTECVISYAFDGTIVSDSLVADSVELPTTMLLMRMTDWDFDIVKVKNGEFSFSGASHKSVEFCGSTADIIERVFKFGALTSGSGQDKKIPQFSYPLIIHTVGDNHKMLVRVELESITFEAIETEHARSVMIHLGTIKI